jgi:hypothetical protein
MALSHMTLWVRWPKQKENLLILQGDSGEEVALWRLTSLYCWSKAKFKSPCNFEESPPAYFLHYLSFMKMSTLCTCLLKSIVSVIRVYWNLSYPLLSILKVIFLERNPLRFIETLISFIRAFVYCLYMLGWK